MHVSNIIINIFSRHMAVLAILVTVIAYFCNNSFTSWIANENFLYGIINVHYLLMIIMFGMGLTMTFNDFIQVFRHPSGVIVGELAQFILMPLIGFTLCVVFQLPPDLAAGVILVGCCPGGTASNVMTYMARGDVALSVSMTTVSTVLAPLLTPLLTAFYIGLYISNTSNIVEVDKIGMFLNIIQIVIIPVAAGLIVNKLFAGTIKKIIRWLPVISCIAICMIIGFVIDKNSTNLLNNGFTILIVVMLHNVLGYIFGYGAGLLCRMKHSRRTAVAIEVGMQNSGMATTLANDCFAGLAMATVPGAVFSAWHNISGAIFATLMARQEIKEENKAAEKAEQHK